ncbi:MAG: TonB-dependent receptor [Pseudomonadota bacterium]
MVATGPLARWQASEIFVSGGAEYRRNSASFMPSPILATGDTIAFGETGQPVDGSFDVFELFAETSIPLLTGHVLVERLELEGAVRYSDYSTAGGEWTWKLGGQWVPVTRLRLRGSWQRAVRAPNIGELLEAPANTLFEINGTLDFCLAVNDPVANGLSDVCIAQGIAPDQLGVYDIPSGLDPNQFRIPLNRVRSGNIDLEPERADTWTFAVDYQWRAPVSGSLGIGYYSIELDDAISADINPFGICAVVRDPEAPVCQVIERDVSGFVTNVADKPLNIASAQAEGIDFNFSLSADAPRWLNPDWAGGDARLSLRSLATRTLTSGLQSTPAAPFIDCAGQFGRDCSLGSGSTFPDFTANTSLAFDAKSVGLALRWRCIGPQDNAEPQFDALVGRTRPPLAIPRVGDRHYLDLGVRVNATQFIELRAGIDNLLKTSPPLLGRQARQSNTDPSRYDIFGRRFFVSLRARLGS